tara:strand:- start:4302 stop:5840 length:1539 start_codon:yes stop_codon:yes gene_type:complete
MKIIFSVSLLLFTLITFAQELPIKVLKSDVFKEDQKTDALAFTESDGNGGLVTLRAIKGGLFGFTQGYVIEHFDENLNLLKSSNLDFKITGRNPKVVKAISVINNALQIVVLGFENKSKELYFSVFSSSIKNFDFKEKKIVSIPRKELKAAEIHNTFYSQDYNVHGNFNSTVSFSDDKKYLSVFLNKLFLFDENFEIVFEKFIEFPDEVKKGRFLDLEIDGKNETVYLLTKFPMPIEKRINGNDFFHLFKINRNEQKKLILTDNKKFINNLAIVRANEKMACVGFYSDKNINHFGGIVRMNIDIESFKENASYFQNFSEQLYLDKYGKEKEKEPKNILFRAVFMDEDGNIFLNAEEYYEKTIEYRHSPSPSAKETKFYFNDIIAAKISESGELLWSRNINKSQNTSGRNLDFLSYISTNVKNDMYIFINASENVKQLRKDRIEFLQSSRSNANLMVIRINQDGDIDYENIVDQKDRDVNYQVRYGSISDDNEIIISGVKNKDVQYVKIKIED